MSHHDAETTVTTDVGPWAMVPIWVLDATDEHGKRLSGSEIRVYVAIRSFADQQGRAFPFVETIAERAKVDQRTAEKAITRLRSMGLVSTTRRYRDDGSIARCDYKLRDTPSRPNGRYPPADPPVPSRPNGRSKNTPLNTPPEHPNDLTSSTARFARVGAETKQDQGSAASEIHERRSADRQLFRELMGNTIKATGRPRTLEGRDLHRRRLLRCLPEAAREPQEGAWRVRRSAPRRR